MALQKMVDGVCMDMSKEEEDDLKAHWADCDLKRAQDKIVNDRKDFLMKKYPDVYETLDLICLKLGLNE